MIANRAFYARSLTQTGLIRRFSPRATNEFHVIRVITVMYDGAGDTAECVNSAGYTRVRMTCVRMMQCGGVSPLAGLTHSGVRAFLSQCISAVLTRIGKINGRRRGPRIEVRDDSREGRGRERWRKMSIVEITRMASCGASDHPIRHDVSSCRINSKIAIVRELYIYIYFFFLFSATAAYFLQRSNYYGFIAGINCARRLFDRLKLTTAIYLEHCTPARQI